MATTKYMHLFDGVERDKAQKVWDYYDGRSDKYLQSYIDTRRTEAVQSGMTPFTRNLTKMVVDKSGMLFSGRAPTMKVYDKSTGLVNEDASIRAQQAFEDAGWIEYFNNFDAVLRMMKTALTYVQIEQDEEDNSKRFVLTALSQANAAAHFKSGGRKLDTLIYYQGMNSDGEDVYALIEPERTADLYVTIGEEQIENEDVNPYGFVTAAVFHDTNIPMRGNWNPIPMDLVQMNFAYNKHITDSDYSSQWTKFETLYTNAALPDDTYMSQTSNGFRSKIAARNTDTSQAGLIGGPSKVVQIAAPDGEAVFLQYIAPKPELAPLDEMVNNWFKGFAQDWSVTVDNDTNGYGGADSGFKLMVREIPNIELRKKRQRMMEQGFKRLYEIMLKMSLVVDMGLIQDTELFIEFAAPEMPIDEKVTEDIWDRKIKSKRATIIEYYMVQLGLDREQAEAKVLQDAKDEAFFTAAQTSFNNPPIDNTAVTTSLTIV